MVNVGDSTIAVWQHICRELIRCWMRLDTDWKSVACGIAIVGLVVGFDLSVAK